MSHAQEIQRRLRDADVRFDAHDHGADRAVGHVLGRVGGCLSRQCGRELRDDHRKGRFVDLCLVCVREQSGEFGNRGAEARGVLRRGVDWDVEDGCCADHFLGRADDAWVLVDGWAEFFLDVADAKGGVLVNQWISGFGLEGWWQCSDWQ